MQSQLVLALVLLWTHAVSSRPRFSSKQCGYGYKCHPYRVLSSARGYEVREYAETLWVTWEEHEGITSMGDYPFLVEFADEKLSQYFEKENYGGEKLEVTTPLRIEIHILNLRKPRRVSYPVHVEKNDGIPAPFHPFYIKKEPKGFVYAKKVSPDLKYKDLLHEVAKFMVQLTLDKNPFDPEKVSLALYTHPVHQNQAPEDPNEEKKTPVAKEEKEKEKKPSETPAVFNEIWISRTKSEDESEGWGKPFAYSGNYNVGGGGLNGGSSATPGGDAAKEAHGFSDRDDGGSDWNSRGIGFSNGGDSHGDSRSVFETSKTDGTHLRHIPPQ